jgi:hypothetical protein
MDDEILVAGGNRYWYQGWTTEELLGPAPPPPVFSEPIEEVRQRIARVIGAVSVQRRVSVWHPAIDRLLKEDEIRRAKLPTLQYTLPSDQPRFDTPWERRRLRILNALFIATSRVNAKPSIHLDGGFRVHFAFFWQHFWVRIDKPKDSGRRRKDGPSMATKDDAISLSILSGTSPDSERFTWQDDENGKVESRLGEIAVQLIMTAEILYRERAISQYSWRIERKAQLEEEERQRQVAAERAEMERRKRTEQNRVDRLLKDSGAFHQAAEIRRFVEAIRAREVRQVTYSPEGFERWSQWALAQADRIDPSVEGKFLASMDDRGIYLTPPTPICRLRGHGRGFSADFAGAGKAL